MTVHSTSTPPRDRAATDVRHPGTTGATPVMRWLFVAAPSANRCSTSPTS